jgi:hypothetical protein
MEMLKVSNKPAATRTVIACVALLTTFAMGCSSAGPSAAGGAMGLGSSAEAGSSPAQFGGSWLCNFTLVQGPGGGHQGGVATYPPSPVKTVVTAGSSLSINDEESDSEPQSWFCGFNYVISDDGATLVGHPTCQSYNTVLLQSAKISLSTDGNELTISESGTETGFGITEQSTFTGMCARN